MALIRSPEVRDIARIMVIEEECFESPWTLSSFYVLLRHHGRIKDKDGEIRMSIIELERKVTGYIVWEYDSKKKEGHVLNIAIKREKQRRGHGAQLMNYVLDTLENMGAKSSFLEVRESNLSARRFYETFGMVPVDRVEGYYGNEDAIVYRKEF